MLPYSTHTLHTLLSGCLSSFKHFYFATVQYLMSMMLSIGCHGDCSTVRGGQYCRRVAAILCWEEREGMFCSHALHMLRPHQARPSFGTGLDKWPRRLCHALHDPIPQGLHWKGTLSFPRMSYASDWSPFQLQRSLLQRSHSFIVLLKTWCTSNLSNANSPAFVFPLDWLVILRKNEEMRPIWTPVWRSSHGVGRFVDTRKERSSGGCKIRWEHKEAKGSGRQCVSVPHAPCPPRPHPTHQWLLR